MFYCDVLVKFLIKLFLYSRLFYTIINHKIKHFHRQTLLQCLKIPKAHQFFLTWDFLTEPYLNIYLNKCQVNLSDCCSLEVNVLIFQLLIKLINQDYFKDVNVQPVHAFNTDYSANIFECRKYFISDLHIYELYLNAPSITQIR